MAGLPLRQSPSVDAQPTDVAASFLGKRSFEHYSHHDERSMPVINATATGDARMIVGNVNTNTTITGQVKKVKVYQFPEVQVGYSSRIARDDDTIRRWLTSTDQESIYQSTLARREPATNQWFIEDDEFRRWSGKSGSNSHLSNYEGSDSNDSENEDSDLYDADNQDSEPYASNNQEDQPGDPVDQGEGGWPKFLWLHGGVGCGKTVLCSSIIEKLLERHGYFSRTRVCYFFFSFEGIERGDLSALLRSILSQLCVGDKVPLPIVELYMKCHQTFPTRPPSLLQLRDVLRRVLIETSKKRTIYIVIDALDEVNPGVQRYELLEFVGQLTELTTGNLRVLVTSRNEPDIQDTLGHSNSGWKDLPISSKDVDKDIEKYINNGIEKYRSLDRQNHATKALIREKLIDNANGMFQWSALQLSSLRKLHPSTPDAIRYTLEQLPLDLNETYVRILDGINEHSISSAIRALRWLIVSKRSLYIEELADASSNGLQELGKSPYEFREEALEPFHLVEMLRDLIEVEPALQDNIPPEPRRHKIRLTHFSVQEFLLSNYIKTSKVSNFSLNFDEAHFSVAQDCLVYLYRFNTPPRRLDSVKSRLLDFSLREYAWYNWEKHVLPGTGNESIEDPARRKATILYNNFKSQSMWTDTPASTELTSWLPSGHKERLLKCLNIPYFYPGLGRYFELPSGPRDDPRWFGNELPNAEKKEIALISILPCLDPEDDLRCQLHIVSLRENPAFKAISYALGPVEESPIFIGGSKKSVRPQLANIFRNLRLHQEGQQPRFWADAICLEEWQSSNASLVLDRSDVYYTDTRLLVMLTEIFKEAQEVAISLGDEMPDDEEAIALIHKLVSLSDRAVKFGQDTDYISESGLFGEVASLEEGNGWSILTSLLSRMWWQRRWTIQEMVLARSAVLFVGSIAFSFDVIDRFVEAEPLIRTCLDEIYGSLCMGYHTVFDSQAWDNIKNLSRSRQEYNKSGSINLQKLIWRFRLHTGMYREDVIRTIAPLTWTHLYGPGFEVSYDGTSLFRLDLPEAISEAYRQIIEDSKSLDILSFNSAYSLDQNNDQDNYAPQTWLPAMERDASEVQPFVLCMAGDEHPRLFQASGQEVMTHQFADQCQKVYGAGADFDRFSQNIDLSLLPTRLSLRGFNVDKIERVSSAYTAGIRDKRILEFARDLASMAEEWSKTPPREATYRPKGNIDGCEDRAPSSETIWRTLLADQYFSESRLPSQLPHSELPSSLPPHSAQDVEDFLSIPATQKALKHLFGRRLLMTRKGRLGLAPFGAQEGDTIVIFAGGSVPYVLRETGRRLVGHFINTPLWNFIGECYVHGIMDGELLSSERMEDAKFEPFVLEGEMRKIPESNRPPWHEYKESMDTA